MLKRHRIFFIYNRKITNSGSRIYCTENGKIIFECNNTRYWNSIGYLFDETNYSDEMLMDELEKYYSGDSDYISFKNYLAENEYGGGTGAPAIKYKVQKIRNTT